MDQTPQQIRRIKRRILGAKHAAVIRFPKGYGDICETETRWALANIEVKSAFAPEVTLTDNGVALTGVGFRDLLTLPLALTTAREILWVVGEGKAASRHALAEQLAAIDWDLLVAPGQAFGVRVESTASRIFHEGLIRELVSERLALHGCTTAAPATADYLLDIRLKHDRLTVSYSLGGRPLYKRRYKTVMKGAAPVKEDVAAAAVRATKAFVEAQRGVGLQPRHVLIPFAGSGTLGFETYLALANVPPFVYFGPLAIEASPCCPEASMSFFKRSLVGRWRVSPLAMAPPDVCFIERDADQCAALEQNVDGFNQVIRAHDVPAVSFTVICGDFFAQAASLATGAPTFVALNPPFGDRLGTRESAETIYRRLAGALCSLGEKVDLTGFAFIPPPLAERFVKDLSGFATRGRTFDHGGRKLECVSFCNTLHLGPRA